MAWANFGMVASFQVSQAGSMVTERNGLPNDVTEKMALEASPFRDLFGPTDEMFRFYYEVQEEVYTVTGLAPSSFVVRHLGHGVTPDP